MDDGLRIAWRQGPLCGPIAVLAVHRSVARLGGIAVKVQKIETHEQTPVQMDGASGAKMRMLIGPAEQAGNFHMRHFSVDPGGYTPHHQHDYEHEIMVLKGAGVAKSEQGDRPFSAGDIIWVPANEIHQFQNTGDDALEFICLIPAPMDCSQ
jgi:quercetin dioxygenase-like cupin family protein